MQKSPITRAAAQKKIEKKFNTRNVKRISGDKKLRKYNHQKSNVGSIQKCNYKDIYQ